MPVIASCRKKKRAASVHRDRDQAKLRQERSAKKKDQRMVNYYSEYISAQDPVRVVEKATNVKILRARETELESLKRKREQCASAAAGLLQEPKKPSSSPTPRCLVSYSAMDDRQCAKIPNEKHPFWEKSLVESAVRIKENCHRRPNIGWLNNVMIMEAAVMIMEAADVLVYYYSKYTVHGSTKIAFDLSGADQYLHGRVLKIVKETMPSAPLSLTILSN